MSTIKVLIVEPGKVPREAEVENTLSAQQAVVGGMIEAVYPWEDPVGLICNEEGKLMGLPLNRSLEDYDIIAGTFFICGLGKEDFTSLSPDLMEKYKKKFLEVEMFLRIGGRIQSIRFHSSGGESNEKENI